MVTLEQIRNEMKERLKVDKELHQVDVHATTIDEALADAAVQLNCTPTSLNIYVGDDKVVTFGM